MNDLDYDCRYGLIYVFMKGDRPVPASKLCPFPSSISNKFHNNSCITWNYDMNINESYNFLAHINDINIVVDPNIGDKYAPIRLNPENNMESLLYFIADDLSLKYEFIDDVVIVIDRTRTKPIAQSNDPRLTKEIETKLSKLISYESDKKTIEQLVQSISSFTKSSVTFDASVYKRNIHKKPVNMNFIATPAKTALSLMLWLNDLDYEYSNGTIIVYPRGERPTFLYK